MASASSRRIRIATRESQLALWQANFVKDQLSYTYPDCEVELVPVSTIGDRDRTAALRNMGGQGVFTREVQRIVLDDQADIAVHSLKDLPTVPVDGLQLAGIPARAPRFDALLLPLNSTYQSIDELPENFRIGTGSPRRQAQLWNHRPDLDLMEIRGNVETRIRKLDEGEYDAIILAEAGLRRLGLADRINFLLQPPVMLPAVGQAALGIECRHDDSEMAQLLEGISDEQTIREVTVERACLATLKAGCHAPVGVMCQEDGEQLSFQGVVLSADGRQRFDVSLAATIDQHRQLGVDAAQQLIIQGADQVL